MSYKSFSLTGVPLECATGAGSPFKNIPGQSRSGALNRRRLFSALSDLDTQCLYFQWKLADIDQVPEETLALGSGSQWPNSAMYVFYHRFSSTQGQFGAVPSFSG